MLYNIADQGPFSEEGKYNGWYQLYNCIESYFTVRQNIISYYSSFNKGKEIVSRVGVEYNPFVLQSYIDGNPAYVGSNAYGQVDAWYVLDNYLEGIHPATNGSSNPDTVIYYENIDSESPTDKMEKYLDNYASTTFHNNILISFAKQIAKM